VPFSAIVSPLKLLKKFFTISIDKFGRFVSLQGLLEYLEIISDSKVMVFVGLMVL
jgi:hypothetical protein